VFGFFTELGKIDYIFCGVLVVWDNNLTSANNGWDYEPSYRATQV
jgi:hypothetical protein